MKPTCKKGIKLSGITARATGLLLVLCILLPLLSSGQKANFQFYNIEDGLAGNNTSTVAQDDLGFIWFINDGKLHRFDGRNFIVFQAPLGMDASQDPLLGLASWQDSLLFIWNEHQSFILNPKTGNWKNIQTNMVNGANEDIFLTQRLGHDHILLNSFKKGYSDSFIWQFRRDQLEPVLFPEHITSIKSKYYWCDIDLSGHTYLAYQDTLYQMDASGSMISSTPLGSICTDCYNLCFQFAHDNALVLMANWQFFLLDRSNNRFVPHPANRFLQSGKYHLHRFILDENGSIWACGQDRNLVYFDALNDTLFNFHDEMISLLPYPNDFKGLFRDRTGIVWIDTRRGLLKVRSHTYPFTTYFDELNQSNAYYSFRGLTEDAQGIMYGVYYDGIARFDPDRRQNKQLYTFTDVLNLYDLSPEGDKVWVNGGQLLDPRSGRLINVPSPLRTNPVSDNGFFSRDRNGRLWWASHYTLYYLEKTESGFKWIKALELPEKLNNRTEAFSIGTRSGKFWISYKGLLLQYDPETGEQDWIDPKDRGLPVSRITCVLEEKDGRLWLGTDAGLVLLDPSGGFTMRYEMSDGLPNDFICGILPEGDSCLWLSTNHGLSRFQYASGTFTNFFEEDGLTSNEFNRKSYFKAGDGRMFFGGIRGVNAFYPGEVMQAHLSGSSGAQMVLSAFEYTDDSKDTLIREVRFDGQPEFHLYPKDWSYTFEYALTDYNNPNEIFYSYKMEGFKDSWSAPSRFNFTRYSNLPSGEYVFRVKARDSQGHWHPSELVVKVMVHAPWWATWWAYSLYFILLFTLAYLLRRYELNRQRLKHNLDLKNLEAGRLKELDGFKTRLYTNLTHEFRTPLTVILGMAGQIKDGSARPIEENGRSLLRLINQLLDLSRLENKSLKLRLIQGDMVSYLRYLTESFQTYANSKNLSLRFFSPAESLMMDFDPEQTKQVLVNLISNALKFTPSGGEVLVRLVLHENKLDIEVKDSGIGIAEAELPRIFNRFYQVDGSLSRPGEGTGIGLAHTQELVKLMGGDISVTSKPDKGSSFVVSLHVRRDAPPLEEGTKAGKNRSWSHSTTGVTAAADQEGDSPVIRALPHLLIIEDNSDVVTYLRSILGGRYQLDIAYNGKIGIEKALQDIPDLIVSDVMMPEKDGFEVCDTLKNDDRTSHIPVILLTARADAASRISGLRRGADVYMSKPFDKEELLVQLEMLVERQKRMAAWFSRKIRGEDGATEPDAENQEAIQVESAFVQKVRNIIEANYTDENFALPQLCLQVGMSRSQLFRKMTALIDTSPSDFIRSFRLDRAKHLLETTDMNVSEVTYQVGYKDIAHFSRSFQEEFGFPPSATKK